MVVPRSDGPRDGNSKIMVVTEPDVPRDGNCMQTEGENFGLGTTFKINTAVIGFGDNMKNHSASVSKFNDAVLGFGNSL